MGTQKEKAGFSFNMLDRGRKGYLTENDVKVMMHGVFELWNIMTNSRVIVLDDYVYKVFQQLDTNRNKLLTLDEYEAMYCSQNTIFGWFEYLNQDEEFLYQLSEKSTMQVSRDRKINKTKTQLDNCLTLLQELDQDNSFIDASYMAQTQMDRSRPPVSPSPGNTVAFSVLKFIEANDTHIETDNSKSINPETYGRPRCEIAGPRVMGESGGVFIPPKGDFLDSLNLNDCFTEFEVSIGILKDRPDPPRTGSFVNIPSPMKVGSYMQGGASYMRGQTMVSPEKMREVEERAENRQKSVINLETTIIALRDGMDKLEHFDEVASCFTDSQHGEHKKRQKNKEWLEQQNADIRKTKMEKKTKRNLGVFFGHANWNLMLNMLIGIRAGLKKLIHKKSITESDYELVVRHDIKNFSFSKTFDKKEKFLLFEYAPHVFDNMREKMGVTAQQFHRSVGPENILGNLLLGSLQSMTELASAGKSGSLFYLTPDNRFFIKTISEDEFDLSLKSLKPYYEFLSENPNSLIYKVTGLYKIETYINGSEETLRICVMQNIFWYQINPPITS
jgi:hypothetical protein